MPDDKNNIMKIGVAVALLVVAVVIAMRYMGAGSSLSTERPKQSYFYDLGSGELFAGPFDELPPIDAPQGGASQGVQAVVLTCGRCTESEQKIAYLLNYSSEAKAAIASGMQDPQVQRQVMAKGTWVAPPPKTGEEPMWVLKSSPEGKRLVDQIQNMCEGQQKPTTCWP